MSNYEKTRSAMAQAFLAYDQEAMIRRFRLRADADWLYLTCLGRLHRISRHTGLAEWSADGFKTVHPAGFSESMVFYDLLCNAKPGAVLAGQFVNQSQLARLHSGALAPGSSTSGKAFDGREAALSAACEAMGGGKTIGGDGAYLLPLLEQIPVVLRFWSSDDEFPASLQLSWDKNILDFLHYETVCYAAGYLLDRLRAAMES